VLLDRLGVKVEVVKSTDDSGYTELIRVEAGAPDGEFYSAAGTLGGKGNEPRIVSINRREVEVAAEGKLLVLENLDQPGMVGEVGSIVVRVDTEPSENARNVIKHHAAIKQAKFVQL
jgi:D-3-phosphoglycerate dehydrogenase